MGHRDFGATMEQTAPHLRLKPFTTRCLRFRLLILPVRRVMPTPWAPVTTTSFTYGLLIHLHGLASALCRGRREHRVPKAFKVIKVIKVIPEPPEPPAQGAPQERRERKAFRA